MTCLHKLTVYFIFIILSINQSFSQTDCVLREDKDNVKVYACNAEHSKIKSIKTTLIVHTTLQQLIDMVLNVNGYNNWQYHTINAHILKRISNSELIYYSEVVAPWPVSNRDLVVQLKLLKDDTGNLIITANSIPDYIPMKKGIVRVPMSKSQWLVKTMGESSLSIEFTMLINPGGSVPAWMINMVAAEAPFESFRDFKTKIESINR